MGISCLNAGLQKDVVINVDEFMNLLEDDESVDSDAFESGDHE